MEKETAGANPEDNIPKELGGKPRTFEQSSNKSENNKYLKKDITPNHINIPEALYGEVEIEYIDRPEEKSSIGKQFDRADTPLWHRLLSYLSRFKKNHI